MTTQQIDKGEGSSSSTFASLFIGAPADRPVDVNLKMIERQIASDVTPNLGTALGEKGDTEVASNVPSQLDSAGKIAATGTDLGARGKKRAPSEDKLLQQAGGESSKIRKTSKTMKSIIAKSLFEEGRKKKVKLKWKNDRDLVAIKYIEGREEEDEENRMGQSHLPMEEGEALRSRIEPLEWYTPADVILPQKMLNNPISMASMEAEWPGAELVFQEDTEKIFEEASPHEEERYEFFQYDGLLMETAEIPWPDEDYAMQEQYVEGAPQQENGAQFVHPDRVEQMGNYREDRDQDGVEKEVSPTTRRASDSGYSTRRRGSIESNGAKINERPQSNSYDSSLESRSNKMSLPSPKASTLSERSISSNRRVSPTDDRKFSGYNQETNRSNGSVKSRTDSGPICKYYQVSKCKKGRDCNFRHA